MKWPWVSRSRCEQSESRRDWAFGKMVELNLLAEDRRKQAATLREELSVAIEVAATFQKERDELTAALHEQVDDTTKLQDEVAELRGRFLAIKTSQDQSDDVQENLSRGWDQEREKWGKEREELLEKLKAAEDLNADITDTRDTVILSLERQIAQFDKLSETTHNAFMETLEAFQGKESSELFRRFEKLAAAGMAGKKD